MEVGDAVMVTEDDETSTGWCFAVTSLRPAVGSTGSLLLDSGSDEHFCTPKFAVLIPTGPDRSILKLKDVQQNDLAISGQKTVPMLVEPTGGKRAMEATSTFQVTEVCHKTLSLGKLVRRVSAGTAVADELMDDVNVKESHVSSSADPAVEPPAEVATTPALVLKTWSSIKELHSRLRELGAPIYGTKDVLFRRLRE